jgi:2-methylcitrate dehydratase PrpD
LTGPSHAAKAFIDHALSLEWEDLPEAAQVAAKTFLHDTLCVGIAGTKAPFAEALRGVVEGWGCAAPDGGSGCSVLGRPELSLPGPSAAFLNAYQIHSQEYDCVHEPAVVHPFATVVSALMAEAERSGPYHGRDFLAALVAGIDVVVGLGLAASSPLKFFRPATAGIFGSVAALARLKRVSSEVGLDGLGFALAFASGTMQAHVEGKATLAVQVANGARGAVAAMDLAVAGLPGPQRSIDGPFGYLTLFETESDPGPVIAALGTVFRVTEISWKPFPTGRAAHGGIVAVQTLMRDHGLTAHSFESLIYEAPPLIRRLVGRPALPDMTTAYARLCLAWLAAVVLTKGDIALSDFTPQSLNDPRILDIAARVTVTDNGASDPAAFSPARAIARFTDGRIAEVVVTKQLGSPEWKLTAAQHDEKARTCLAFAGLLQIHERLASAVADLDRSSDVAVLIRLAAGGHLHKSEEAL